MPLIIVQDINPWRLSGSPAFLKVRTDMAHQPNIRIDVTVFHIDANGDIAVVGTDSLVPDDVGNCVFEISEFFRYGLSPSFNMPVAGSPVSIHINAAGYFFLKAHEFYGEPPVQQDALIHPVTYYVSKGSIPQWVHHCFYNVYSSYQDKLQRADARLSLEHLAAVARDSVFERIVCKDDILKVFIHAWDDFSALKILLNLSFYDGTQANYEYQTPVGYDVLKGQVIEFDLGYHALNLDSFISNQYPGKKLRHYTASIENHLTGPLCPQHRFILNDKHHQHRRQFIFLNSMGAYDTFSANGETIIEAEYDYEIVDTPYWPGATGSLKTNFRSQYDEVIKCNTGYISKDTLAYLPEFFMSTEVYEIIENRAVPIVFKPGKIPRARDASGLYHVDFEYSHVPNLILE
jgi:hypothetical protein